MVHRLEQWTKNFASFTKVAEQVLVLWRRDSGEGPLPHVRSLAAKISDLSRGKCSWWLRRPQARAALAEVFEADEADVFAASRTTSGGALFAFPDFPQLRPFDPRRESPCEIATIEPRPESGRHAEAHSPFDWFAQHSRSKFVPNTLVRVPQGAGRHFFLHWMRQRGVARVIEVGRLEEAVGDLKGASPTVVSAEEPCGNDDLSALRRMSRRQDLNLLVLVPYEIIIEPAPYWPLALLPDGLPEARMAEAIVSRDWERGQWSLAPDWRKRFLAWVAGRIEGNTLLDPNGLEAWLTTVDPANALFQTPGDLLPLCAAAHEAGERKLPRKLEGDLPDRWISGRAAPESRAPRDEWLRSHGSRAVSELAVGAYRDLNHPWGSGATVAAWASLLPAAVAPTAAARGEIDEPLRRVVAGKTRPSREAAAADLRERLTRVAAPEAIGYLRDAGLLRPETHGKFSLHPRWIVRLRVREWLRGMFRSASPAAWGRLALSPARRDVIDSELDRLDEAAFLLLVERSCSRRLIDGVGDFAAIESLFGATARRLEAGWKPPFELIRPLLVRQIDQLVRRYGDTPPASLTRLGVGEGPDRGIAWLADCWAWCVHVPRSDSDPADQDTPWVPGEPWLFPNTHIASTVVPPAWLAAFAPGPRRTKDASEEARPTPAFLRLLRLARHIVRAPPDLEHAADLPDVLLPATVLAATAMEAGPPDALVQRVLGSAWAQEELLRGAESLAPPRKTALAAKVWFALLSASVKDRPVFQVWLPKGEKRLVSFVMAHLDAADLVASISAVGPNVVVERTLWLPARLRNRLARWISEEGPEHARAYLAQAHGFGPEDTDGLLDIARRVPPAADLARAELWRVAGDIARAETAAAWQADPSTAGPWYRSAPDSATEALLVLAEGTLRGRRPEWLKYWLLARLPGAGAQGERIFGLLLSRNDSGTDR